jgi:hypothetical protein
LKELHGPPLLVDELVNFFSGVLTRGDGLDLPAMSSSTDEPIVFALNSPRVRHE